VPSHEGKQNPTGLLFVYTYVVPLDYDKQPQFRKSFDMNIWTCSRQTWWEFQMPASPTFEFRTRYSIFNILDFIGDCIYPHSVKELINIMQTLSSWYNVALLGCHRDQIVR